MRTTHANEEIRNIFETECKVRKFSANDMIYFQGDSPDCFYYLKKGRVRVFMTSVDGDERTLSIASKGELLGEAAFFDKLPRMSGAVAVTDVEVAPVNREELLSLIGRYPRLAMFLLEIQAGRVRELSSQLDSMSFQMADGRIARALLDNIDERSGELRVDFTHEQLSDIVGASRVTVSKTLARLRKKGILSTGYRKIVISDVDTLREISDTE